MGHRDVTRRTLLKGVAVGGVASVADGVLAEQPALDGDSSARIETTANRRYEAESCLNEQNYLLLDGQGSGTEYWIEVTGEITPGRYEDPELRAEGGIGRNWVNWAVVDYYDDYYYTGRIISFDVWSPENVTVYHNDSTVAPGDLVTPRDVNYLLLDGHGSGTEYRIEVTRGIEPAQYEDPELRREGGLGYDWVDWRIVDYYDDYYYTGEITTFDVQNPDNVTVYHDCVETTPRTLTMR